MTDEIADAPSPILTVVNETNPNVLLNVISTRSPSIPGINNIDLQLEALKDMINKMEKEYKYRELERTKDIQLLINNIHQRKSCLMDLRDYEKELQYSIKQLQNEKLPNIHLQQMSNDSEYIVNEVRCSEFIENIAGIAEECGWEMHEIYNLLKKRTDADFEDHQPTDDESLLWDPLLGNASDLELGRLGDYLKRKLKSIDKRNAALSDMGRKFQRVRYGYSMQYLHCEEIKKYKEFRRQRDLQDLRGTGNEEEKQNMQGKHHHHKRSLNRNFNENVVLSSKCNINSPWSSFSQASKITTLGQLLLMGDDDGGTSVGTLA